MTEASARQRETADSRDELALSGVAGPRATESLPLRRSRVPIHWWLSISPLLLLVLVVQAGRGHAQAELSAQPTPRVAWIRAEEVPFRADLLLRHLETAQSDTTTQAAIDRIEKGLAQLGPALDTELQRAHAAAARSTPFVEIDDLRRELATKAAMLEAWEAALTAESKRVSRALDQIAQAQRLWSETRARPETVAAGEIVGHRVQASIDALGGTAASLEAWQAHLLAVSDPLVGRHAAIDEALERLDAAAAVGLTTLFVPSSPPLWHTGLIRQLASELPHAPEDIESSAKGVLAYVEQDPRPLAVQVVLAVLLMFSFRRLSTRARKRRGPAAGPLLAHPYAVGLLLALLATPWIHPLAPQRFRQLMATIALLPAARVVTSATGHVDRIGVAGLVVLFLADWIGLALTPLPTLARFVLVLTLTLGLGLAFRFATGIRHPDNALWVRRAANLAVWGVTIALLAEIGGWANLGTLLSRSIIGGAALAVSLYAIVVALEPILFELLRSPMLRRSHLLERSAPLLQRHAASWLRWLAAMLWLYLLLLGVGLRHAAAEALSALLRSGVSVGALSITVGDVLAFVLTLLAAMLLARIVTGVLEEDVYPRTSLPRGVPFVLSTLARYAVYSMGFLLALAAAGVQLSQLTILLGGLGVGVGLGLQDLVKNFAAGLTVLLERRVHVGDALQIPSQEIFGRVLSIGMRASVVRSWNGSEVVIPNADLVSSAITNWTLSDRLCRIEVPVGVAYGTDPERVLKLLLESTRSVDQLLADPAPQALFKGFGDSSLDFVLRAWTDEGYEQTASLTSALGLALHRALRDAGIEIPFPQRDVNLVNVAPGAAAALSQSRRKE